MNRNTGSIYIDDESRPYWQGLNEKELRIQNCNDCNSYIFYPRTYCTNCFSAALDWVKASGTGHIYSYTIVHQAFGRFKNDAPFVVAIVELREGVKMMSRIIGEPKDIQIGKEVEVTFVQTDEEVTLPYFKVIN